MNIFSKVILRLDSLVIDGLVLELLDHDPNNLRAVELVPRRAPCVIAEVIEEPKMSRGKDELDAIFDGLRLNRGGGILAHWVRLWRVIGLAEDAIPASGERVLAESLWIHAGLPPQPGFRILRPPRIGGRSRRWTDDATGPHPA